MPTWDADVDLSPKIAHRLVVSQFPEFDGPLPTLLGAGWDNVCYLYPGAATVFRFPTRAMGGQLMATELAVLPHLTDLPLPIPRITHFGEASGDYPYRFMGYPLMRGTTADRASESVASPVTAHALGHFLRELHAHPAPLGVPTGGFGPERLSHVIRLRFDALTACDPEDREWVQTVHSRAMTWMGEAEDDGARCLCHGDLYPRHVLVDQGQVAWVIDWGDVQMGHPAQDLSLAFTLFDTADRPGFWEAYGVSVPSRWIAMARLKAVVYAFALLAYGQDVGDEPITRLGRTIGRRLLEA